MEGKKKYKWFWTMLLVGGLISCTQIESFPPIPEIEFRSFDLRDTLILSNPAKIGDLVFGFVDGDGDIGWEEPDTIPPDDSTAYNLFFTLFEKIEGDFIRVDTPDIAAPINYIIPFIEREGQNKTIKGSIKVRFQYLFINFDTIRYEFYMVDRAFNKSNVETTPEIILSD